MDPYATRTPATIQSTDSPAEIESLVTQAQENGGGWVQLVFHQICDGVCPGESQPVYNDATPETLDAVAAWLQTQPPAVHGEMMKHGTRNPPPMGRPFINSPAVPEGGTGGAT